MTTATVERPSAPRQSTAPSSRRSGGRAGTVVVLILSLVLSAVLRQVSAGMQSRINATPGAAPSRSTLGNMNSFALALLLGGLRGPLVIYLWSSSESQKADRDLEDFDTKVEWIRLLMPEFDSVHIFQIWNKAYNISAMMASPANKFTVIMEALDYARSVDEERPGDVNILNSTSNVYGGKLGTNTLPEFPFYSRQFREESLTDANRNKAFPEGSTRFARLDNWKPLLDEQNHIVPRLLTAVHPRPADVGPDDEWNDGSELQYLKMFDDRLGGFPLGMSPIALSYNYAKRAEVAVSAEGQKPLQLSAMVIDSRPGLQLKAWEEDDLRRGRAYEAKAFDLPSVPWSGQVEQALAELKLQSATQVKSTADFESARYYYRTVRLVSEEGLKEYTRHLKKPDYVMRVATYQTHIADLETDLNLSIADEDYLSAMIEQNDAERRRILTDARDHYYKAAVRAARTVLTFFTEDKALSYKSPSMPGGGVLPPSIRSRPEILKLEDQQILDIYPKAMFIAGSLPVNDQQYSSERADYGRAVGRAMVRLTSISAALGDRPPATAPTTAPAK